MRQRYGLGLAVLIGAFGCDGGGDDDDDDTTPPPKVTRLLFDMTDICAAKVPSPTDLFRDDEGKSELSSCPGPADPIERELFLAQLDEGTPLNAEITIPLEGSLDGGSISSSVAFSLTGPGGTIIPPLIMLKLPTGSTSAADFEVVFTSATYDQAIRIRPEIPLEAGYSYAVIATNEIRDNELPRKSVAGSPLTTLLVGPAPISAGNEGLDAAGAARLERQRLLLQPIVRALADASPKVTADKITSIQFFSTVPDPLVRTTAIFEAYRAAVRQGRYPFMVTTVGGDLDPAELYPGLPDIAYQNILAYRRGTITVPQVLDEDLRQRSTFPQVVRTIDIPFIVTVPRSPPPHAVVLYTPGFGRSKLDARAVGNEMAGTAGAAVLALDLRCHGDRSPDDAGNCQDGRTQSEVAALADEEPNNDNMELVGPDGIPDASGQYFFPGDARALRDTQIAAAIEILHVYNALRDVDAFAAEQLSFDPNDLHLMAHGHSAFTALLATAFTDVAPRTVQVPAGGAGTELISGDVRESFVATLPEGIGADRADEYIARLEAGFLRSVSIETIGPLVKEQLTVAGEARRLLLNHGRSASAVPVSARDRLKSAVPIPSSRVSQHPQVCDDFFIFSCDLGSDDPTAPREQMVTFVFSNGTSVVPP